MLQQSPNDPFLRYAMALELHKASSIEPAIEHLEALRQDRPEYLALYYQLGAFLQDAGRYRQAIEVWRAGEAVAKSQGDSKTQLELESVREDLEDLLEY